MLVFGMEHCQMCGGDAYVRIDNRWICKEHYCDMEAHEIWDGLRLPSW